MKRIIVSIVSFAFAFLMTNCQEESKTFGSISTPSNLNVTAEIIGKSVPLLPDGDGSGNVKFSATADNAISYKYDFGDGSDILNVPSGINTHRFKKPGTNTYTVTISASGKGGVSITTTLNVTVYFNFTDDEALGFLTGGTHKDWYWSASEVGHLGEGINNTDITQNYWANEYQSVVFNPNTTCLYDDVLTFTKQGSNLQFQLNNNGTSLVNREYLSLVGLTNTHQYNDTCASFSLPAATGTKNVTFSPSESLVTSDKKRGTVMTLSDGGFMGFYTGTSTYEIMSITENRMVVRSTQEAFTPDGASHASAWYFIFTTIKPIQVPDQDYTQLAFSDEFNIDGAPDPTKWSLETGAGGWGNSEKQYYSTSSNNVIVQNGSLKITAKRESVGGADFTSARLKSENKFAFTYGKVEVSAKLPTGGGTWPAIWMLGKNYPTQTWPACGEIDMMEMVGNNPDKVFASLHYPNHSGGSSVTNTTTVSGASTGFHLYKVVWTPSYIKFYVDNVIYHSFVNQSSLPFNGDFFLILNVAMGGNFGGSIDPAFNQSTMEIDYVRVYQ